MSEFKVGYIDSEGNFVALDSPINSSGLGSKVTVDSVATVSAFDNSYQDYCCSKKYTDQRDQRVENMFDKIKNYKVYGKTTVVYFTDGTKETVVCSDEDKFDVEQGITMCTLKRMLGDKYKRSVRSIVKAMTLNEENVRKLEEANKEAELRKARKEKQNRENKLRMKARYEARLAAAIEEEKKKLKNK